MKTIFITGGHVTPALALMDELSGGDIAVTFIGRKYAVEGKRHTAAEYDVVRQRGIRFLPISAGRLQRTLTFHTIPSLFKVPIGFIQALWYVLMQRPSVIVSFGGYVGLPVALAGWILGVPVLTHEQTRASGLANRIIGAVATRICVTFPETAADFPAAKTVVTGLPMRRALFSPGRAVLRKNADAKLLYITGGSLGSQSLNEIIAPVLETLTKTYVVVHQTGNWQQNNFITERYVAKKFFSENELAWLYRHAHIVIGRAGANTVLELAATGTVAVLVPLPWSGQDEQQQNARWLADRGGARVLSQTGLTGDSLLSALRSVEREYSPLLRRAKSLAPAIPRDGAARLAKEVRSLLGMRV